MSQLVEHPSPNQLHFKIEVIGMKDTLGWISFFCLELAFCLHTVEFPVMAPVDSEGCL